LPWRGAHPGSCGNGGRVQAAQGSQQIAQALVIAGLEVNPLQIIQTQRRLGGSVVERDDEPPLVVGIAVFALDIFGVHGLWGDDNQAEVAAINCPLQLLHPILAAINPAPVHPGTVAARQQVCLQPIYKGAVSA
jgi:hypothetical protein